MLKNEPWNRHAYTVSDSGRFELITESEYK